MMRGLSLTRRRLATLGMLALLIFVAAAVLGWRGGSAAGAAPAPADATAWDLPHAKVSDADQDAGVLRQRRPWGGQASFSDSETPSAAAGGTSWRLAGIVERGNQWFALISIGGQSVERIEYRALGDPLPGGGKVMKVDADSVTVGGQGADPAGVIYRLFDAKR
jgi:hypothetical protein